MLKNLLKLEYPIKNIKLSLESRLFAAFSANGLAPIIFIYLTQHNISQNYLFLWFCIHIFFFIIRLFLTHKLNYLIEKEPTSDISYYFNANVTIAFLTPILNSVLVWLALLNGVPDLHFFMLSIIIVTLSAGSISTSVSLFKVYVGFILLSMLPLLAAILYHGGELFYLFAFILTLFTVVIIKAGYKQYLTLENSFALKDTFETIYNKSYDSIALMKNNRLYDCNPATLEMFQYDSKEELLNTHMLKYMPLYQADGAKSMRKTLEMAKRTLKYGHTSFEWLYTKKDGTPLWCDIILTKIVIDGEVLIHGVYRDISKKKKLQQEQEMFQTLLKNQVEEEVQKNREKDKALLQQSRLAQMGEMISMIAHQWRQPLSAITAASGSIQLKAKRDKLEKDIAIKLAQKISQYSQHLSITIDDFRNFFKENKKKENTTLKHLVSSTLSLTQLSLQNNNIKTEIIYKDIEEIQTYENELKQVLINIIKNAEDALLQNKVLNPLIHIIVDKKSVTINDNAGGIDSTIIDKIFEPYFSTKKEKDGTGLGLYMSKIIIEEHCEGKLIVKNNTNGASFTISL